MGLGVAALVVSVGLAAAGPARAQSSGTTWLGVYTQTLSDQLRRGLDYSGDNGVLVNRVVPGSPADEAGVRNGDVIVSVNSRSVDSPDALAEIVRGSSPGQRVAIQVVRDGDTRTLSAELGTRPGQSDEEGGMNDEFDVPVPPVPPQGVMPRTPRAPRAPRVERYRVSPNSPRVRVFENEKGFEKMKGFEDLKDLESLKDMELGMGMGRGRLGIRIETLTPDLGEYFDVPGGKGVVVMEVMKGTPAERAGLKPGDVITHVGSRAVDDADELVRAVSAEDTHVKLTVLRKGARRTVEADLERGSRMMRLGPGSDLLQRDMIRSRDLRGPAGRRAIEPGDREEMRREIEALRRQIDELERQLEQQRRN
jgi:membrane-associated protease RseP (regulator of RpoE activity)